jgi:hypothetical protein
MNDLLLLMGKESPNSIIAREVKIWLCGSM